LLRAGHIALQTGPAEAYRGLEPHAGLARLAQHLAPVVHRDRVTHAPKLIAALRALPVPPTPLTVVSWDLWAWIDEPRWKPLAHAVRRLLENGGTWIFRAPADSPNDSFTELDPWLGPVDRRLLGRYGSVPRITAQAGMGARRRSLHTDPTSVVWTIRPRLTIERRHALTKASPAAAPPVPSDG